MTQTLATLGIYGECESYDYHDQLVGGASSVFRSLGCGGESSPATSSLHASAYLLPVVCRSRLKRVFTPLAGSPRASAYLLPVVCSCIRLDAVAEVVTTAPRHL